MSDFGSQSGRLNHNEWIDLFGDPISTKPPGRQFDSFSEHPVRRSFFPKTSSKEPLSTNKFYSNIFLGTQTQGVWTLPYMIWWNKTGRIPGLSVSHTEQQQFTTGPIPSADPFQYYISPIGIASITFSAKEFAEGSSNISLTNPHSRSVNLNLHANTNKYGPVGHKITFPLVQGMGFVTGRYDQLTPIIFSCFEFVEIEAFPGPYGGAQKWRLSLSDGKMWLLYVFPAAGSQSPEFTYNPGEGLVGSCEFTGVIQIAKADAEGQKCGLEEITDSAAGTYPATVEMTGGVAGDVGSYRFEYKCWRDEECEGALMYALPHHVASFDDNTARGRTGLKLQSPTKGLMEAVRGNIWTMTERNLPTNITWLVSGGQRLNRHAVELIERTLVTELQSNITAETNLNSMYFSGKASYLRPSFPHDVVKKENLTREALGKLTAALDPYVNNRQNPPLVYDDTWKGLITSAIKQDLMADFGNGMYNDHHFHHGYFVYTAAVIVRLERNLNRGKSPWFERNRDWVNLLVRDVANPSTLDPYFPESRSFDWFHGHSWAKGLFESADGKDQESSSEDMNYGYSQKLWGIVTGDKAMEARADLMLSVMKRSSNQYFLLKKGNRNHPPGFIKNKVTGILFENKVDHTTYFGHVMEYIQGIHMIPITPISPWYRDPVFCREEWETWFSNGRVNKKEGGWNGILQANRALFDPKGSWRFFTDHDFVNEYLDPGASKSWYLALIAGLGGAD
ncbi:glycoside hydrolase [Choiromyces venosus 120613-1]|uniref:glucan endo-1,3-beta-D-glucosidase n=1 Tax=Choiromyces venosus 120613-1 TaxID=1336337 RepID=A0A3N4JS90_9PEZI|nr:glycoside hydrolase [Choiromyces venosus 120613-1]